MQLEADPKARAPEHRVWPDWQIRWALGSLFLLHLYATTCLSDARLLSLAPQQMNHGQNLWFGFFIAVPGLIAFAINCGPWPTVIRWSVGIFLSAQIVFGHFLSLWLVSPAGMFMGPLVMMELGMVLAISAVGLVYAKIWPRVLTIPTIERRATNAKQISIGQMMQIILMVAILTTQLALVQQSNPAANLPFAWSQMLSLLLYPIAYAVAFMPSVWLAAKVMLGHSQDSKSASQYLAMFTGLQALTFIAGPVIAGANQLTAIQSLVCGIGFYVTLAYSLGVARLIGFRMAGTDKPATPNGDASNETDSRLSSSLRFAIVVFLNAMVFTATLRPALQIQKAREALRTEIYDGPQR